MSLRMLVLVLLLANLGYGLYSLAGVQSWIDHMQARREPERLAQQVNADAILVKSLASPEQRMPQASQQSLTSTSAASHAFFAPSPVASTSAVTTQSSTQTPPPARAAPTLNCASKPTDLWVIYMGPYPHAAQLQKKKTELAALKVSYVEISKPTHPLGLSLGQFDSEEKTRHALTQLKTKGIKTATPVLWRSAGTPCVNP